MWQYGKRMTAKEFVEYVKGNSRSRLTETHVHGTWSPSKKAFNGKNYRSLQDGMRRFHIHSRGWSDIGQHATIFPDGKVMTGRDINRAPASAYDHNDLDNDGVHPFMVEMIGNFDKGHDKLEGPQLAAAVYLVNHITGGRFRFHREMQAGKSCPGSGITRSWFEQQLKHGRCAGPFDRYQPGQLKEAPNGAKFTRTLQYVRGNQMTGSDVLAVQRRLGVAPVIKHGKPYGVYGPKTERAVRSFQKKARAKNPTGEVGDWTWGKLFGILK
ncbi:Putative peptidoglycan binding domain-containing protein [Marininema mesophilum]|uniref:Putative peptidoglycan binding domain-containing protein n=1 Tax=Marininema mesophilum TaxID=1048340 RepID=A0A1H3BSJ7_9BACL|nr:N-acetylmuramoyl-L-alanine amidase [Marininema mesophilum]SDX44755.1 Putative peptidoglycan binding domain-containing protein [Marininema mesophilum]